MTKRYLTAIFAILTATALCAQSDEKRIEASLENPRVAQYMENVMYVGFVNRDYNYPTLSKITKYNNPDGLDYRLDQPSPVIVTLDAPAEEPLTLTVVNDKDNSEQVTVNIPEGETSAKVWNLTPQQTYSYSIANAEGTIIDDGSIVTDGHLRMIRLDSGANIRDIGGWETTDGHRLRYGKILRGAEIGGGTHVTLTEDEIQELRRLGAISEIDFRMPEHFTDLTPLTQSPLGPDASYLNLPIIDKDLVLIEYKTEYGTALKAILEDLRNGKTTYVHCTYGSDRTGVLIALIESICGVTLSNIYKDYELSAFSSFVGLRYYYVINARIVRPLNIMKPEDYHADVRQFIIDELGMTAEELDEMASYLIDTDGDIPTLLQNVPQTTPQKQIFSVSGTRLSHETRGINIINDGGRIIKVAR